MIGSLTFKDPVNLQINGKFEGSLETKGALWIGEKAQVQATIHGEEISIAGSVQGPVTATRRVELLSTARVMGKVTTPKLIVQEGALLHGSCDMVQEPSTAQWMTIEELARYLEIDGATIQEWARSGKLPAQREGDQYRFDRKLVEEWLAQEKIR
jgi:excisionase family DNA binding protein